MTIKYNGMEITFENNYRPEEIIVDGEIASMKLYADNHDGKNWMATASGNTLYYMTNSGKTIAIPQGRFQNTWQDEVRELISKTGKTMKEVSEITEIPYRTLQDWRGGKSIPSNVAKYSFRDKINDIIHNSCIWFTCHHGKSKIVPSIRVESASSIEDAVEQLSKAFVVVPLTNTSKIDIADLYSVYEACTQNGKCLTGKFFKITIK